MTRTELENLYDVDENGVIDSPGKFEGEHIWVPYFYNIMMDGEGEDIYAMDTEDTGEYSEGEDLIGTRLDIEAADIAEFPELEGFTSIMLSISDTGFVYGELET